ncbi:MAG: hypothetical protein A2Z14_01820 [Chloroflexi bacterium RBG_16_48_8]|nr:MAG: hypothetical protein A2Z14_01820 [Chloroflexi bacterium RBG_16_48_8]
MWSEAFGWPTNHSKEKEGMNGRGWFPALSYPSGGRGNRLGFWVLESNSLPLGHQQADALRKKRSPTACRWAGIPFVLGILRATGNGRLLPIVGMVIQLEQQLL